MKKTSIKFFTNCSVVAAFLLCTLTNSFAQSNYHAQALNVSVTGTSTLHDWEMKSSKGQFDANITVAKDKLIFTGLSFNFPAESLKSGHGAMDKNTYKALNTSKNPTISFVLTSGNVSSTGTNTYLLKGMGKLTIAGTTLLTDLETTLKYNPTDKSFTCTGTKKFKMSEYGVKPPTVMMGAIKTGDAIAITYNLTIKG